MILILRPPIWSLMEQKEAIITQTEFLFNQFGIKSVSMEDVAVKLGVSKKTIYQYFESKADLVKTILLRKLETVKGCIIPDPDNKLNAIETMFSIFTQVIQKMRNNNPVLIYDLRKYYPALYKVYQDFTFKQIECEFANIITKGINEGLYRQDIKINLLGRLYFNQIEYISGPELVDIEPDFEKRYRTVLLLHLRGICTPLGLEKLENILLKNEI